VEHKKIPAACDDRDMKARLQHPSYPTFARKSQRENDLSTEADIHGAILPFIRTIAPEVGGWRSKAEGARLKALGVTPGIPDLCLIAPIGRVFFIEVKTARGKLSPEQRKIHEWLTAIGVGVAVCRSVDDARWALRAWNIPTREHDPLAHLNPTTRQAWLQSAKDWRAESPEEQGTDK
jgi:hypothetical protein